MKISVTAHPNSKKPRVEKDAVGQLHVYVSQKPHADQANQAVLKAVAAYLKVRPSSIRLISGKKAKQKVFEVIHR